jgi:ketosteroid isomerase-like protein
MYAAYNRGDIETTLQTLHPEIEWQTSDVALERQTYRGHEGVRSFFEDNLETWDDHHVEAQEFIEAGEYVVVPIRVLGRGKASGIEVAARFVQVWKFRDRKIAQLRVYVDKAEALEAAGLGRR